MRTLLELTRAEIKGSSLQRGKPALPLPLSSLTATQLLQQWGFYEQQSQSFPFPFPYLPRFSLDLHSKGLSGAPPLVSQGFRHSDDSASQHTGCRRHPLHLESQGRGALDRAHSLSGFFRECCGVRQESRRIEKRRNSVRPFQAQWLCRPDGRAQVAASSPKIDKDEGKHVSGKAH